MCIVFKNVLVINSIIPNDLILSASALGRQICLTWEHHVLPWKLARHWHRVDGVEGVVCFSYMGRDGGSGGNHKKLN